MKTKTVFRVRSAECGCQEKVEKQNMLYLPHVTWGREIMKTYQNWKHFYVLDHFQCLYSPMYCIGIGENGPNQSMSGAVQPLSALILSQPAKQPFLSEGCKLGTIFCSCRIMRGQAILTESIKSLV